MPSGSPGPAASGSPAPPANGHPSPGPVSETPEAGDTAGIGAAGPVDVNGDGYSDLVLRGRQGGQRGGDPYVGAVYGGEEGLDPAGRVIRTRAELGIPPADEGYSGLLYVEGTGDLDGDGFTDILVDAGRRYIVWGGPGGLVEKAAVLPWPGEESPSPYDKPTAALGDFNGDRAVDAALLELRYDTEPQSYEAAFLAGPFSRSGEPAATRELPLPVGPEEAWQSEKLVPFDADGNRALDLMIVRSNDGSPAPHLVLASGPEGPMAENLGNTPAGNPVAAGDLDGDRRSDLLVSSGGDASEGSEVQGDSSGRPGHIDVYSGADGFAAGEPVRITRGSPGVPGSAGNGDGFGESLLVADVQNDGYQDVLAELSMSGAAKRATVLFGGPQGISGGTAARLEPPGLSGGENGWSSWEVKALRDYNGDGAADLLLGDSHTAGDGYARYAVYPGTAEGFGPRPETAFSTEDF